MENQSDYNEALLLIVDEFDGSITEEQLKKLQLWRLQSVENERIYQEFHAIKIEVDALVGFKQLNVDEAWDKVDATIAAGQKVVSLVYDKKETDAKRKFSAVWLYIAASIVMLLGFYKYLQDTPVQIYTSKKGGQLRFTLPDGSYVTLNSDSQIEYDPKGFTKNRTLNLIRGEAYLEVKHQSDFPFQVIAGKAVVEDLGTSFSVNLHTNEVRVLVSSGSVMLKNTVNGASTTVSPQQAAMLNFESNKLAVIPLQSSQLDWVKQALVFTDANLAQVVASLEETFKTPIALGNDELATRKLTANLSYHTLDSALAVVSASLQLKATKSEEGFLLTN